MLASGLRLGVAFAVAVACSASGSTAPYGLMADFKSTPSMGVSSAPKLSWIVPHLPSSAGCAGVRETNQRQHSYQVQLVHGAKVGEWDDDADLLHDTGRILSDLSANVLLDSAPGLAPGTSYAWRVRTWSSADGESCASSWATGRFVTALFDGFAAQPVWLAQQPQAETTPSAGVECDLSGVWRGNGNGPAGVPITITAAPDAASSAKGERTYVAKCSEWTNKLVDRGDGTLTLFHGSGNRIAHAVPYNSTSASCTQIKFDNHDDWCKADTCSVAPTPTPGPRPPAKSNGKPSYAYFRHTEQLRGDIASATIFVSANQDGTLFKLLSAYRLYINGKVVSVGPGRSNSANSAVNHTVYDTVDITSELREVRALYGDEASVTFAAQCYHHDGGADAMFMLQAHVMYTSPSEDLHTIVSDASWVGYDATPIYNPTGGMGGDVPLQSTDNQPAEYINASRVLSGWQDSSFKAGSGWQAVASRTWMSPPVAKETLPIQFTPGVKPVEMTLMSPGHWFIDFGTEIMAGLTMTVTGGKAGTKMDVRLSEELMCNGCNESHAGGGGPNSGKGCNTCNYNDTRKAILFPMRTNNKYEEIWTLQDGVSEFENHEYKLFRYGEIMVETDQLSDADLQLDLTAWVVNYPWSEAEEDLGQFNSSNDMLNRVWELCKNTVKVTSLDTTTDSNTREKLPYEADGYITGGTRRAMQRDQTWERHSSKHNIRNPTWPTEWRQIMSLMAYEDYMATGDVSIATELWDTLLHNTMYFCVNSTTNLVDFSSCSRDMPWDKANAVRDITDWPADDRDGYQMTDISTVINAYFVACMNALSTLSGAMGNAADELKYGAQANATAASMRQLMMDDQTGLFTDTVHGNAKTEHSAWHSQVFSMWSGVAQPEHWHGLIDFLKGKAVNTGVTGSVYAAYAYYLALYEADFDHGNFALQMLTTCDNNSFCHMLLQGATATMEAWTRQEKDNLSWSHPWASAPGTAIPRGFFGINPTSAGYKTFVIKPQPGDVEEASISVPTHSGLIKASFKQQLSQSFTLTLQPPANTVARVCLPKLGLASKDLIVDGKHTAAVEQGDYLCVDGVGSGSSPRVVSRK